MEKIMSFLSEHYDVIFMGVMVVMAYIKAKRAGKNGEEALMIAINTLKDENKMDNNGETFKPETIIKAKEVANEMEAGVKAIQTVEEMLNKANRKKGIKIGSHRGKPIYLEDAVGIFGLLKGILRK